SDGARGQRDIDVVGVRVRGCDEPPCALETGLRQAFLVRPVALDEVVLSLPCGGQGVLVEVDDDVVGAGCPKLRPDPLRDASVAADDVVVSQLVDRPPPSFLGQPTAQDALGNPLDDRRGDECKDSHPCEHHEDREDSRRVVLRNRVQAEQGARDDRAVEGLQPALVRGPAEADRPEREHRAERAKREGDPAWADPVHATSIVSPWTTTPRSASSTSTSTPSTSAGSTRTLRTSASRTTSSR